MLIPYWAGIALSTSLVVILMAAVVEQYLTTVILIFFSSCMKFLTQFQVLVSFFGFFFSLNTWSLQELTEPEQKLCVGATELERLERPPQIGSMSGQLPGQENRTYKELNRESICNESWRLGS